MKVPTIRALLAGCTLMVSGLLLVPLVANAAQTIPYKVNFQGRLTDNNGNILVDGSYNIKFRLWDAASSGTNKWEEDRVFGAGDNRIAVSSGLFNIQFGDLTVMSPSLFSGVFPLYLEVELPTPATATCATNGCASFTEGAMTPRQAVAASPYAFNSDTLDGFDASSFVQLNPGSAQTGNININGTITSGAINTNTLGATGLTFSSTTGATITATTNGSLTLNAAGTGTTILGASTNTNTQLIGPVAGAASAGVQIGANGATQLNFLLNNASNFADGGTCTTTVNSGALYYNTASNGIRGCINGGWEDLISTAGLGIMIFGVVPDSGLAADQGDLAALGTAGKSGPCKVSAATASTVNIQGCVAFSGGRKVIVAANAGLAIPLSATNIWVHVCLNGTSSVPLATATTTELLNLPTFSLNNPILCLADIKVSVSAIQNVYDTRAFTTSEKDFATVVTAGVGLGWAVIVSGSSVTPPGTTTAAQGVRGVVVASNGTTSTTTPNAILVMDGPAVAKATAGTAGAIVTQGITSNGYVITGGAATNTYSQMGVSRNTFPTTACATTLNAANCNAALFFNMKLR